MQESFVAFGVTNPWDRGEKRYAGLVNLDFICNGSLDPRLYAGTEHAVHHRPQRAARAHGGHRLKFGRRGRELIHVTAAAFGISALLLSSALAFNIVKYVGAAYLIYLGIKTLLTREEPAAAAAVEEKSLRRAFSQAVLVNFLNPKSAMFFFAFLPPVRRRRARRGGDADFILRRDCHHSGIYQRLVLLALGRQHRQCAARKS